MFSERTLRWFYDWKWHESGIGESAENVMNEPHCFVKEEKQVSIYTNSDNDL